MNYTVVGGAIIYLHTSSGDADSGDNTEQQADRASKLAEGSYACLYLISALSTIVSSVEILVQYKQL